MNIENVNKAIAIMQRAQEHNSVYMCNWQKGDGALVCNEEAFHSCGNVACFAGHIAVSPEFRADGGTCNSAGTPIYRGKGGATAIAVWLGISSGLAASLVYGETEYDPEIGDYSDFYDKVWREVNAADVLDKLYQIKNGTLT
jgi:hypothetical protein